MGGLLGAIDVRLPFFVAGGLALMNLVYGYFVLPESLPVEQRRPVSLRNANPVASLRHLRGLKNVGGLVSALAPVLGARHGVWLGWSGATSDASTAPSTRREGSVEYVTFDLSARRSDGDTSARTVARNSPPP